MNNFPRSMGTNPEELNESQKRQRIEQFAKKSLHLTKDQIEAILNSAFDEAEYNKGLMEGINSLSKTSPTKTTIAYPEIRDPEQEIGTPKASFDYLKWLNGDIHPDTPIINISDPRCE